MTTNAQKESTLMELFTIHLCLIVYAIVLLGPQAAFLEMDKHLQDFLDQHEFHIICLLFFFAFVNSLILERSDKKVTMEYLAFGYRALIVTMFLSTLYLFPYFIMDYLFGEETFNYHAIIFGQEYHLIRFHRSHFIYGGFCALIVSVVLVLALGSLLLIGLVSTPYEEWPNYFREQGGRSFKLLSSKG